MLPLPTGAPARPLQSSTHEMQQGPPDCFFFYQSSQLYSCTYSLTVAAWMECREVRHSCEVGDLIGAAGYRAQGNHCH